MKFLGFEVTADELKSAAWFLRETWHRIRVPKAKKKHIGIVVALKTEQDREKLLLEAELVRALRLSLEHSNRTNIFHILRFGERLSSKIHSPADAEKFVRRARAHFIVYGDLKQRKIKGENNFVFRLHGLVIHQNVHPKIKETLQAEFSEVLPRELTFSESDEFLGFELTKNWLKDAATYIVGIAAMISWDLDLSYLLFTGLESDIKKPDQASEEAHPVLGVLRQRIGTRIIEVLRARLLIAYRKFAKSRDRSEILKSYKDVSELLDRFPEDHQGRTICATILFFQGKVDDAIDQIKELKSTEATSKLNLGFLYAYKGEIAKASELYRKATYMPFGQPDTLNDLEAFLSDVIEREKDKIQLLFYRGYLNLKFKQDYALAKKDFEYFLELGGDERFQQLGSLAKKYISESKSHLGI